MKKIKELLKKENLLHIAIILLGTILILIPAFHSNIWFDESYSVAISNHLEFRISFFYLYDSLFGNENV